MSLGSVTEAPSGVSALTSLTVSSEKRRNAWLILEASLARYEQGVKLLRQCYQILEKAERKIEILKSVDEAGQPVVVPMDDEDLSLDEKQQQRSKRRSSGTKGKKRAKRPSAAEDPNNDSDSDVPGELF